jgi:D-3-phosphoglycerate dehydrogenase
MRIDDIWCQEALDIIKDVKANVLITKMNVNYSYEECSKFDLIASPTTGLEHIDNRDIPLVSLKGETEFLNDVHASAEHTWALIMALIRKVPMAHNDVCKGNWDREAWQGTELHGKTLGIVGYGRVGKQVERCARAFGMNILICDPPTTIAEYHVTIPTYCRRDRELNMLLQESDIVTVHVPLNNETYSMFNAEQFEQMKPTAYFINTSRGAVVNEYALYRSLKDKQIAGAALDVVLCEPNPWSAFIDYANENDNLILTPHIAGNTVESRKKTQLHIAQRIKGWSDAKGNI